jgi:hypothetical protein
MFHACEITFLPKASFEHGGKIFEVCQKPEGISVARHAHVFENEGEVSRSNPAIAEAERVRKIHLSLKLNQTLCTYLSSSSFRSEFFVLNAFCYRNVPSLTLVTLPRSEVLQKCKMQVPNVPFFISCDVTLYVQAPVNKITF